MLTARPSTRSVAVSIMTSPKRDLASVDLHGLGAALRAYAGDRGLGLSEVLRQAVAALVEAPAPAPRVEPIEGVPGRTTRMSIRLRPAVAACLANAARTSGASRDAYLAALIERAPPPPLDAVTALGLSTEQLAVVSRDLNELIRTLRREGVSSGPLLDDWLRPLLADVRQHLGAASRLVAELRPARAGTRQSAEAAESEASRR